jgi:hypothetical protein
MKINDAFPSTYLKAADLGGKRVQVIIDKCVMEDIGGEHKPIVKFQGKDRGLVVNKTNASTIAEIAGTDETDDWKGVKIVLYPTKTEFQGKRVDCIRIDYPTGAVAPKPVVEEDDSVPF